MKKDFILVLKVLVYLLFDHWGDHHGLSFLLDAGERLKTTAEFTPTRRPGCRRTGLIWKTSKTAFSKAPFVTYFMNSGHRNDLLCHRYRLYDDLSSFAFSRLKFKGRDVIFSLLLSLMMVPFEMLCHNQL